MGLFNSNDEYKIKKVNEQLAQILQRLNRVEGFHAGEKLVDLFVMSGQSNMQGQSEGPITYELSSDTAYEYKLLTNTVSAVKHPFGEDIGTDLLLGAHNGYGSLNVKFAESYYNTTSAIPLMVGAAKGGTKVEQWLSIGSRADRYNKLVEKANAAVTYASQNGLTVRNKFFVWLQGESDATTTQDDYESMFLRLWNDLKADCGFTKCFIIRPAKYGDGVINIMKAQETLSYNFDDIILTTRITGTFTEANGYMQSNKHYTNAGYDLVGNTAGYNIGDYVLNNTLPVLESEPYTELQGWTPVTKTITPYDIPTGAFEFNFRTGSINEVNSKIGVTKDSAVTVNADHIVSANKYGLLMDSNIVLDGDATFSMTAAFDVAPTSGSFFYSFDALTSGKYIYYYHSQAKINVVGDDGALTSFASIADIEAANTTWNHYVWQKQGTTYRLYFNNTLIQEITNGSPVLTINRLAGIFGKVKHAMFNQGAIVAPMDADPTFYANSEQGTTA